MLCVFIYVTFFSPSTGTVMRTGVKITNRASDQAPQKSRRIFWPRVTRRES